jgi:proton-translocating NADH-quinone oxidoreductase chain N
VNPNTLALLTVFVPIVGALTIFLIGPISQKLRSGYSVILAFLTTGLALALIPFALSGKTSLVSVPRFFGISDLFMVDALGIFTAAVCSGIAALIVLYSIGYISKAAHQTEYYAMVVLFIGSMMGIVFSANLIFLYIFWEIAAICSWRLIGFFREREFILKADKAFLMTFFGATFMLVGFILVYSKTGTFNLMELRGYQINQFMVIAILLGMFAKSATLPLHSWLPDAGIAPSPVTALLHAAVLVKIGVFGFVRLFCFTFKLPPGWSTIIGGLAVLSALVAACAALVENDMKRILAYSTISQIGYIFLGFSMINSIGVMSGMFYILAHGLAKAGLFLCAGIIEHETGIKDIRKLGGLIKTMPITAISFFACAVSVIGIPPFAGFFSKFLVIASTVKNGQIVLASVAIATAILTLLYLLRLFNALFMGEAKLSHVHEGTKSMLFVVVVFAVLSLLTGIFGAYPMSVIKVATSQVLGLGQ